MKKKAQKPMPPQAEQAILNAQDLEATVETVAKPALSKVEALWVVAFGLLLFASMSIQTAKMSVILSALAVASLVIPKGRKPMILCVPVIGLVLFGIIMSFAAALSPFENANFAEYVKFLAAFDMAVILVSRYEKKQVPALLWAFVAAVSGISLICVDMDASGIFFRPFNAIATTLGISYEHLTGQMVSGRITGLYNDPNVTGCMAGMVALLGLYLISSESSWKKKLIAAFLTGINAMNFFMSMSRGAILCFAVACIVWLIAAGKGNRILLFIRMMICAVVTMGLSSIAMKSFASAPIIPAALTLLCGVVIFVIDLAISQHLVAFLSSHVKAARVISVALFALVAVYGIAAVSVKGPGKISNERYKYLVRYDTLDAGEYTLQGDWDDMEMIRVVWQRAGAGAIGQWDDLYAGNPDEVKITVPEDGARLQIIFYGDVGTEIRSAVWSNGSEVVLNYPLMPSFVAERYMEGLRGSKSLLLRAQYDKDAFKIFLKSPLYGHGYGSSEELNTAVQPFYYESKYVHNHILQVMCDAGLIGLAAFLAILGGSLWLIWKALRKKEDQALAAAFLAVWVLMNTHSLMEINFCIRAFEILAYGLLMLPALYWATPLIGGETVRQRNRQKTGTTALMVVCTVTIAFFGMASQIHRVINIRATQFETHDFAEYMHNLENNIRWDIYDDDVYMTNYISYAVQDSSGLYTQNMLRYVNALENKHTYSALSGLGQYYYMPLGRWDDVFRCTREGMKHESTTAEAWNLEIGFFRDQVLPYMGEENVDIFLRGMLSLAEELDAINARLIVPVDITEENEAFLTIVRQAAADPSSSAYELVKAYARGEV